VHHFAPLDEDSPTQGPPRAELQAAIKRWTRETLGLREDAVVTVTELACQDAGCPLVETVVAVFEEGGTRQWKFTRPNVTVTKTMVRQALAGR
jgi:hypothetical protein